MISDVIAAYHPAALLRRLADVLRTPDVDVRVHIRQINGRLSGDLNVLYLDTIDAKLLGYGEPDHAAVAAIAQEAFR
ncbi:hypothetical protein [Craterilacuibacter sp. RT1T]|uniref:hypothetical protein n=1 Tax=Craterilacuibacter sp. RT1T TaxID=2942211 RepID=UPI0020C020DF|nr:hypothetical protein [Craterilacuibacter sp. RT1T]MCL6262734.1 hypothetical protein [Craterilacuibacter sp. RT1T]